MHIEISDADPRRVLTIDLERRVVRVGGERVQLSRVQYELLELLAHCKGTMVSRDYIIMSLYRCENHENEGAFRILLHRLRAKLRAVSRGREYIRCQSRNLTPDLAHVWTSYVLA